MVDVTASPSWGARGHIDRHGQARHARPHGDPSRLARQDQPPIHRRPRYCSNLAGWLAVDFRRAVRRVSETRAQGARPGRQGAIACQSLRPREEWQMTKYLYLYRGPAPPMDQFTAEQSAEQMQAWGEWM